MLKKIVAGWRRKLDFQRVPVQTDLAEYQSRLIAINDIKLEGKSDQQLGRYSRELQEQAIQGTALEVLQIKAYALVREAARRVLGQRPFDPQVLAGMALHDGKVVEMLTGEGKTLAAVFPAYLNALTGRGVHLLTCNDYLAQRDAAWMGPVFGFLGLSTGWIDSRMGVTGRKLAYACDLTYVTAKEAGFDYLRSFLCYQAAEIPQRPFNFAIIDEADSILIDEGRIPLVIAADQPPVEQSVAEFAGLMKGLKPGVDYCCDAERRNVYLTEAGIARVERELAVDNLYSGAHTGLMVLLNHALQAEVLLTREVDYLVRDGRVEQVDAFTGRVAANRQWPDGLQAALEAKEGLKASPGGRILGSITLQHFLNTYPKLAGMTGTAQAGADDLKEFYNLDVAVIPPYRPCIRIDEPDRVFTGVEDKLQALTEDIGKIHATGRPILVGTGSVRESEQLAARLSGKGIRVRVLNAKNDAVEAEVIAEAGALGAVTISTNMAGRGTDIRLGGRNGQDRVRVAALGGLCVIGTNRFESARIDDQLRGRAGRQGDPGSSRFYVSLEDELWFRFGITAPINFKSDSINAAGEITDARLLRQINRVQLTLERQNFEIRKDLWKYAWMVEQQRQIIHRWRQAILFDREPTGYFEAFLPERYGALKSTVGPEVLRDTEKYVVLYQIDRIWSAFLEQVAALRETIHLVQLKGGVPLAEFHRHLQRAGVELKAAIEAAVIETLARIEIGAEGIDQHRAGLQRPSATWTYLVNDMPFEHRLPDAVKFLVGKGKSQ